MATSGSTTVDIFSSWLHLKFSWSQKSQSIENNTTTINWQMDLICEDGSLYLYDRPWSVTIDGQTFTGETDVKINAYSTLKLASGTAIISHNADGTKVFAYSFTQEFKVTLNNGKYMSTYSGSGSDSLTTIARASQPSLVTYPNTTQNVGDFGEEFSIHMNTASQSFKHTVRYEYGDRTGTIATNVVNGTTWAVPLSFMNDIPNATSASGRIYVDTYSGSTLVGTKYTGFTVTVPASVKPSCSVTLDDITIAGDLYGQPVQGLSQIKVTVNPTQAYSSPISSYSIIIDGVKYASQTATTGFLVSAGDSVVTVTVTDKRGRTSDAWTYTMKVLEYAPPSISYVSVHRCDEDGTENDQGEYVQATFSAEVAPLKELNDAHFEVWCKKTTDTGWKKQGLAFSEKTYSVTDESFIFEADTESSYDVLVVIYDNHDTTTRATSVSTAFTFMDWHSSGTGIAFGKIAEKPHTAEFALNSEFIGDVYGKVQGLGSLPYIVEDADLNDFVDVGCFCVQSDAVAETIYNMPVATSGRLIVSCPTGLEHGINDTWVYREQLYLPHDMFYGKTSWIRAVYRKGANDWTYGPWNSTALASYPVNSIYISYSHTSPAELFGGEWTRLTNAFLWASDAAGNIGGTGGSKTHTHSLESGDGYAKIGFCWGSAGGNGIGIVHTGNYFNGNMFMNNLNSYGNESARTVNTTPLGGSTGAGSTMPPYIQVSVWRRTA